MRNLTVLALLAVTLFTAGPAFAEPRGEATRTAEITVPDPFAAPADLPEARQAPPQAARQTETAPQQDRSSDERTLELELRRAEPAPAPRGLVPPVPALELRGF